MRILILRAVSYLQAIGVLSFAAIAGQPAVNDQHQEDVTMAAARTQFEQEDKKLNRVYEEVMRGLDDAQKKKLREDERAWLDYRETESLSFVWFNRGGKPVPDDAHDSPDYWHSMEFETEPRIDFLRAWSGKDLPRGITGEYDDSRGASLDMEETDAGVKFSLFAVRGHSRHTGDIEGVAMRHGDKAYFKQKLERGERGPACELEFTFSEGRVVAVAEKVRDSGAGMGVSYAGTYHKIEGAYDTATATTPAPGYKLQVDDDSDEDDSAPEGWRVEQYVKQRETGYLRWQFWVFDKSGKHGSLLNARPMHDYAAGFRFSKDGGWLVRMQKTGAGYSTLFLYKREAMRYVEATKKPLGDLAWEFYDHERKALKRQMPDDHICADPIKGFETNYRWLGYEWPDGRYIVIALSGDHMGGEFLCTYDTQQQRFSEPPDYEKRLQAAEKKHQ